MHNLYNSPRHPGEHTPTSLSGIDTSYLLLAFVADYSLKNQTHTEKSATVSPISHNLYNDSSFIYSGSIPLNLGDYNCDRVMLCDFQGQVIKDDKVSTWFSRDASRPQGSQPARAERTQREAPGLHSI